MKTEYLLLAMGVPLVFLLGFQVYSLMGFGNTIDTPVVTGAISTAALPAQSQIKLPANIQSSAPIQFSGFEEEVAYYKKNAKNPSNLNIEKAVRNMDKNFDGQCDKCGMAILHCIEMGMENM